MGFEELMLPTTVGLDSNAVIGRFVDLAAGLEGESSHGVNRSRWVERGRIPQRGPEPPGRESSVGRFDLGAAMVTE